MRIDITDEAAQFARERGGALWVWVAYPRLRCGGMQARMHVTTQEPPGLGGFRLLAAADVDVRFRGLGNREPEVLQIGLHGKRSPRVEAYWDGCLYAI